MISSVPIRQTKYAPLLMGAYLLRLPAWLWLWATLTGLMLLRPAVPIDETRYLAVAWEMWWRGSYAVPYLNGDLYAGKPPLYFWLMQAGWWATGVSDWWPRLVGALFGLGELILVRAIARRLWGVHPAAELAPIILLGSFYWTLFCVSIMFETLLGFFALGSVYALIRAWQNGRARDFVLAGLALGGGVLAKGPVVFLPALIIVLLAPWWSRGNGERQASWLRWYLGALGAAVIAALVALAWLVPLALASDVDYVRNLTLHQTGGYVVDSFSHRRPLWWYLPLVPLLLFPWSFWPRAWSALYRLRMARDPGVRLCAAWAAALLVVFSLISGKQLHYLLLMLPAVALLMGRLLPTVDRVGDRSVLLPAAVIVALGTTVIAVGAGIVRPEGSTWLVEMGSTALYLTGASLIASGVAIAGACRMSLRSRVQLIAAMTGVMVVASGWGFQMASGAAYDVRPASAFLARLEAQGSALAVRGSYFGQFHFYGGIRSRIEPIEKSRVEQWAARHPEGYLIAYYESQRWPPQERPAPAFRSLYRGGGMAVWAARDILAHPEIAAALK